MSVTQTAEMLVRLARLRGIQPVPWLSPVPLNSRMLGLPNTIRACLFDLEGVLTDSAVLHAWAWSEVFDEFLLRLSDKTGWQFVPFDRDADYRAYLDGRPRLEGIHAFLDSRGIRLPEGRPDDPDECRHRLQPGQTEGRSAWRRGFASVASPRSTVHAATWKLPAVPGLERAVVSASASTLPMLELAGLATLVDDRVDADVIRAEGLRARPAPDLLLAACRQLGRPARGSGHVHAQPGRRRRRARGGPRRDRRRRRSAGRELLLGFGAERVVPSVSVLLDPRLSENRDARHA